MGWLSLTHQALSKRPQKPSCSPITGLRFLLVLDLSCVRTTRNNLQFLLLIYQKAPWGGHGVFPNIYRDMRHPKKYQRSLTTTYLFTVRSSYPTLKCLFWSDADYALKFSLDCSMAIIGWLMFGDIVRDEVTANILSVDVYPKVISVCIIIFISIIPLSKVPLKWVHWNFDTISTWINCWQQ